MLQLPNYSENSPEVQILKSLDSHPQSTYFISLDFSRKGAAYPHLLNEFISQKVMGHKDHPRCFRAIFNQEGWRLILTFIPQNGPLNPKFHFVHKFIKMCQA